MGKKKRNNTNNNKNNAMALSTSNPAVFSADSSPSAAPPIEGGGAKEEKQESPAVTTSRERKSIQAPPNLPPLMFEKKLDSADSNPYLNRAAIAVHSEEMKKALSLAEEHEKIPYIAVLARDPRDRVYELRLSRNDDVQQGNEFILHHEWGKLVAENRIREGYTVLGFGFNRFNDNQFRVFLRFYGDSTAPEEPEVIFLFEKKIDGAADLKQPAIEFCSDRLKKALQRTPGIRVFTTDPMGRRDYGMSFARHGGGEGSSSSSSSFTLRPRWEKFVAENEIGKGDLVTGIGTIFKSGIGMQLSILRNAERDETTSNWIGETFLLFEKTLEYEDTVTFFPRLVIRSCKDVVKEALDKKLKGRDLTAYVWASAIDATDRTYNLRVSRYATQQEWSCVVHHDWGDVVKTNRLKTGDKIWCWGRFLPDSSIQMKIDVDKESELQMSSMS